MNVQYIQNKNLNCVLKFHYYSSKACGYHSGRSVLRGGHYVEVVFEGHRGV